MNRAKPRGTPQLEASKNLHFFSYTIIAVFINNLNVATLAVKTNDGISASNKSTTYLTFIIWVYVNVREGGLPQLDFWNKAVSAFQSNYI